jgi:hypothetical protein
MGESLFIIGAARTEELGGKLDRVRHQGARFGRLEEIPLGRLSEQELQELVEKLADELEVASDFGGASLSGEHGESALGDRGVTGAL